MTEKHVIIYTDGACDGNPGPGGYGVVLLFSESRKELSRGYRLTTNNRMEIMAAIAALEALKESCTVTIYSDSKYLVDAITQKWADGWRESGWIRKGGKRVPNADLWERLLSLMEKHTVTFEWVKAHAGDRYNEQADKLSYAAIEGGALIEDGGYLKQIKLEKISPTKITEVGQPCRKCGTPVVKKIPRRKSKRDQSYYFEYYLFCPGCKTMYIVEDSKRYVDQSSLFGD